MTYATITDFIEHEIEPTLCGSADEFDMKAIADEVSEYNGHGFVWKSEYNGEVAIGTAIEAYNAICQRHIMNI